MSGVVGKKPVWAEGVLLGQQHFQVFDQYQEYMQAKRQFAHSSLAYGFKSISIDHSALARGELTVLKLDFVLASGRYIEYSRTIDNELSLTLNQELETMMVYVGIASNDTTSGISGYDNSGQLSAFRAHYAEVNDVHDASRSREVMVAEPNLALFTDNETTNYFDVLPLFRLVRGEEGQFVVDERFIPPLIDISASPYLTSLLSRTNNLVNAKANVLIKRRQSLGSVTDFGPNELNSFLLLSGLLPSAKMLTHLKQLLHVHPERLYCEFSTLISKISLFENSQLIEQLPPYHHNQLSDVFTRFDTLVSQLLDEVVPKKMSGLKLVKKSQALYQVDTIDSDQLAQNDFYLAVYYDAPDNQWIDNFADQVKVGSVENIETIVASALNGVAVTHCQRTPNKLAVKSGYEYFRLEPYGAVWQQIIEEQSIAVFVPYLLQSANVEIVSITKQ
ncbi:type VI secretion system baseplate subunit TssK [Thalassotalea ganghwensis]